MVVSAQMNEVTLRNGAGLWGGREGKGRASLDEFIIFGVVVGNIELGGFERY
jgi:hypothetical protein